MTSEIIHGGTTSQGQQPQLMASGLSALSRYVIKPLLASWSPLWLQRLVGVVAGLIFRSPPGVGQRNLRLAGLRTAQFTADETAPQRTILYLHGGGYVMGGVASHRKLAGWLALKTKSTVYLPEYRLAPEHPYPAALEDAVAAYQALIEQGINPHHILIAGDSAGGGLSLTTAIAIRDRAIRSPAALVLLSPWVDASLSGSSIKTLAAQDDLLSEDWLAFAAQAYALDPPTGDRHTSPLFAQLEQLPAMLIQVGRKEILLDDAHRLHGQAQAAGLQSRLQEFEGAGHVFQLHAGRLQNADLALERIAEFTDFVLAEHSSS